MLFFRREHDAMFLGERAGTRDVDGERGRGFNARASEIVGGGESPAAVAEDANPNSGRLAAGYLARFAVLGAQFAVAGLHEADIGIADLGPLSKVERLKRELLH